MPTIEPNEEPDPKMKGRIMIKLVRTFLDNLVARTVALVGGAVGSSIESMRSLILAEQQAEMEEAARKYESAGMLDIAAGLRNRLAQLKEDNPAETGVRVMQNVCGKDSRLPTQRESEVQPRLSGNAESRRLIAKPRAKKPQADSGSTPAGSSNDEELTF